MATRKCARSRRGELDRLLEKKLAFMAMNETEKTPLLDPYPSFDFPSSSLSRKAPRREQQGSKLWRVCVFILGNEFCERLAFYGLQTNLIVYLTANVGMDSVTASSQVNIWSGMCYITALIGAWVADEFLGRYRTILIFSTLYVAGLSLLTLSSCLPGLAPVPGEENGLVQVAPLFVALYIIALGTGGIKSNVSSFGAEQFDESIKRDRKEKESFFNWFYLVINIGSLIASTVVVYVQESISWSLGFAIPLISMVLALMSFVCGSPYYTHTIVHESPLSRFVCVIRNALGNTISRKRCKVDDAGNNSWLDRAVTPTGKYTKAQVDEVKLVIGLFPVFLVTIFYWTIYSQIGTTFILQGLQMDREINGFSIPPAALSSFDTVTIIVLIPIFEKVLYPFIKNKFGVKINHLSKVGWGMVFAALTMVYAGFLECYRLHLAHGGHIIAPLDATDTPPCVDLSIFWQIPSYVLIGTSEILCSIGQIEFFYDQAPDSMRSCCMALQLLSTAFGYYLSSFVVWAIQSITKDDPWIPRNLNHGHLDLYFFVLGALALLDTLLFVVVALRYKMKSLPHGALVPEEDDEVSPLRKKSGHLSESSGITINGKHYEENRDALLTGRSLTVRPYSPAMPSTMK